jgi:hypothetical protein
VHARRIAVPFREKRQHHFEDFGGDGGRGVIVEIYDFTRILPPDIDKKYIYRVGLMKLFCDKISEINKKSFIHQELIIKNVRQCISRQAGLKKWSRHGGMPPGLFN